MYRLLLAGLIALAVAVAPIGSALAAADAMAKPAMEDCHGKKASENHSCCDAMAKCPDQCGVKCCKLMGMIVALAGEVFVLKAQVERLTRALEAGGAVDAQRLAAAAAQEGMTKWLEAEEAAFSRSLTAPYLEPDVSVNATKWMRSE